ncbi:MAG TPA: NAD(P)-dependent oxidoreductase [Burkholderiales bacterium]|nr:NAD(P)-dependent oxidoreductase [Burkholderiales bacterium]
MAQDKFRVGITRDVLSPSGEPIYGRAALRILDDPRVEWEYLPESVPELTSEHASRYDALCVFGSRVSRATVSGPQRRLKLVARFGVGYDTVDVAACSEQGILLTITPDGVRRPVASSVMAFMLALAHRLDEKDRLTREGRWKEKGDYLGHGLTGKALGVIGVGNIGKEVFRLAKPWDMVHLGTDPNVPQQAVADLNVRMVDLDTLLRESDVISVNCLLSDQTRHLISARQFSLMKPSVFFINTARGPVVDEPALIEALASKRIAAAAIDVFEQEPTPADNPLLKFDNVIVAPHAVCHTDECMRLLGESAFTSAVDLANGRRPRHVVNSEALGHASWGGKWHK